MLFVGHRSFDGLSFAAAAPVSSILCCDGGETVAQAESEFGITIHSLEAETHIREAWTSAHIDQLAAYLPQGSGRVIAYSSSLALETLAAQNSIALLANGDRLKRFFDNKLVSKNIFKRLGLIAPHARACHFSKSALAEAMQAFGAPLVVRKLFSSTGSGTFLVQDINEAYTQLLALGIEPGETLLAEQFAEGIPVNINAAVVGGETFVYPPSIQLIGIAECTTLPFGFCGNDYIQAQSLPASVLRECTRQTKLIGSYLARAGFKGLFGMDMIVTPDGIVMPCEINPRLQNSTSLLNWAYKDSPLSPASLHLASFGQHSVDGKLFTTPLPAPHYSQVIYHAEAEATTRGSLTEGRYTIKDGEPMLVEKTLNPLKLEKDEFLLCGSPPLAGTLVKPGAVLFKLIMQTTVSENGTSLTHSPLQSVLASLNDRLQLEPPPMAD